MTAPARLLSVRLQGFKSFAERTLVTFGPGISAVVGPNGSGKSNLADALRWALGEQGRALRSRKSEDVIWAGSDRRSAVGMADVQLTLDNADAMLSVDFAVVELGRRLYRSGENEYLLNRQRVRLRDLVDLLDAAHLAENAFLFIGQGMVDQALALRPEERRPLFEEVAGVRRHERRRRRAEEQLAESEANLARIEDIVAELRPQVRRLAAQAEQATSRQSAGDDLLDALLASAHVRWHEAAAQIAAATEALAGGRGEIDAALDQLTLLEAASAAAAAALDERARTGQELRRAAEEARTNLTSLQLEEGRQQAERSALNRDRERLEQERAVAEADLVVQQRRLAIPIPERDLALEGSLAEAERDLAAGLAELAHLQGVDRAHDADDAALRRASAARAAEAEQAQRRLAEAERRVKEERVRADDAAGRVKAADQAHAETARHLASASAAEAAATAARQTAAERWEQADAAARTALNRSAAAAIELAGAQARVEGTAAAIEDDRSSGFAARMRERGARRLDDGLVVDPGLRAAIDAALAGSGRAYLTTRDGLREHLQERGLAVVVDGISVGGSARTAPRDGSPEAELAIRLAALGGGYLRDALRRDAAGAAGRLLARAVWTPDLDGALELQAWLPAGWVAVPRDGSAVVGEVTVRLGAADGTLERRAHHERALEELRSAEQLAEASKAAATAAVANQTAARAALDEARAAESASAGERRRAEETERLAARRLESLVREAAWQTAQLQRLEAEAERARAAMPESQPLATPSNDGPTREAIATWGSRVTELRTRRDRLAAQAAQLEAARRDVERSRATAEASLALDESRIASADRAIVAMADRERALDSATAGLASRLAQAVAREAEARAAVVALTAADSEERARLGAAEREAAVARDRLRAAEDMARAAERRDLEARLGLESLREQLLAELAGLGPLSLSHLAAIASGAHGPDRSIDRLPPAPTGDGVDQARTGKAEEDDAEELVLVLAAVGEHWAATVPATPAPTPGKLGSLRRRYHELGAASPFALDEYAAVRSRLASLEDQHKDLRAAIDQTRALIGELDGMISHQFRTTFAALETAFDRRFQQLFGGGFARLSLTDPTDLAATGIDIVARPPGKKAQALAMLSGGERALTAVALLFAMLEIRPVPFCVLDEVDAALDEANVGRFTSALRELAETTQFVVITHNRGTIEIADALYGVTVGDDSVSRVISLRLDEATELADRGRTAVAVGPGPDAE
ncbi:MAG: AAA family ATPase [Chloroflexota bacterium]